MNSLFNLFSTLNFNVGIDGISLYSQHLLASCGTSGRQPTTGGPPGKQHNHVGRARGTADPYRDYPYRGQVAPYSAYAGALRLDGPTLANLELLETSGGGAEGSLMACLDTCVSPGAARPAPRPPRAAGGHRRAARRSGLQGRRCACPLRPWGWAGRGGAPGDCRGASRAAH